MGNENKTGEQQGEKLIDFSLQGLNHLNVDPKTTLEPMTRSLQGLAQLDPNPKPTSSGGGGEPSGQSSDGTSSSDSGKKE